MSNVKIVVVVAVDVSLLRIRGHSLASLGNLEMARFIDAQMQIAFASERIHDLLSWAYESRKVDRSG